ANRTTRPRAQLPVTREFLRVITKPFASSPPRGKQAPLRPGRHSSAKPAPSSHSRHPGAEPDVRRAARRTHHVPTGTSALDRRHPFPAALHDVKCAVRWLRAHADRFAIDPQRVGVVGYSAGGQLACLLGMTEGRLDLEGTGGHGEHSSRVQAVVGYYALTD